MIDFTNITNKIVEGAVAFAPKLLLAIVTVVVGFFIVKRITAVMEVALSKKKIDLSLRHFLQSLISILLKALIIIAAVGILGVETTSFIAMLAALGFAIGLALQGSLSNFAGGVMILLFKPYKIGDFVTINGESGTVHKIDVLMTILKTPQNVTIYIPNGSAFANTMTNFSQEENRRADIDFTISYESDIEKAQKILKEVYDTDSRVLNEPAEVFIAVKQLSDSAVVITVRAWVRAEDLWPVTFDMQKQVKLAFDKEGISIPYPQMELHMKKE
ncbi:MAG: mechanosensitive ion channel family protein [Candidatus Nanoarchaeia archaeon]